MPPPPPPQALPATPAGPFGGPPPMPPALQAPPSQRVRAAPSVDLLRWPLIGRFLRWRHARTSLQLVMLALAVVMRYKKRQLPALANWQHWGPGEYVTGLEPGTNPPIGQGKARELGKLLHLDPGKSRTYDLEIRVLTEDKDIKQYL